MHPPRTTNTLQARAWQNLPTSPSREVVGEGRRWMSGPPGVTAGHLAFGSSTQARYLCAPGHSSIICHARLTHCIICIWADIASRCHRLQNHHLHHQQQTCTPGWSPSRKWWCTQSPSQMNNFHDFILSFKNT